MKMNESIACNVLDCRHNCEGKNCKLSKIKVTCGEKQCTCCGSYDEK